MHAFANDSSNDFDNPLLPNLRIMPATKAADCSGSSHWCRQSYHNGLAPFMYLLLREMGRVDQNPLIKSGDCRFEVHMLFAWLVKLYMRIMQHPDPLERALQLASMKEVLAVIFFPTDCQHILMEKYFENPSSTQIYEPCGQKCSQCTNQANPITGCIHWGRTNNLLILFCSAGKIQPTTALLKFVKTNKEEIFHKWCPQ